MAGDPVPLAAVQASVLKTAAGKQAATKDPGIAAQNNAVAQDLAVMADQAKGYTAGVNQGTIVAQDQRSAQSQRLALEASQAAAERQRQLQLEQMQTSRMQLEQQAAAQKYERDQVDARKRAAEDEASGTIDPEWAASAEGVERDALMTKGPKFQTTLAKVLDNSTNPEEAVAILRNAQRHPDEYPWAVGINEDVLRRYVTEYFRRLEGGAARSLSSPRKPGTAATSPTSARPPAKKRDDGGIDISHLPDPVGWVRDRLPLI